MAQRRSRNRRFSSRRLSNVSGFLDDNTNVIDKSDPQWYNKTTVRPSTSFGLTKNVSSILNPDSRVDETQLSSSWYNNLSRGDSTKLMEEIVRSKASNQNRESGNHTHVEPVTESESESESQRKRTKLRVNQKRVNISDKSNVFSRALEKTTESHVKNMTVQMPEGNESESTNDDSRTMKKNRPTFFRNNKHSKENMSNYDDLFNSDSTTENIQISKSNSRSSLKRKSKELIQYTSTPEIGQKYRKTQLEKLLEVSVNKTLDNTVPVTPIRELRNRSTIGLSTNKTLVKSSQKQAGSATVYDSVDMSLTMVENKSQKRRPILFSQESKSKNNEDLFDDVFENDNESNPNCENELIIDPSTKIYEENLDKTNKDHGDNESETSSIPKYIRRTRSVVLRKSNNEFAESGNLTNQKEMSDNRNETSGQSSRHNQDHNASLQSVDNTQDINKSRNLSNSRNKSAKKSYNVLNKTAHKKILEKKSNESSSSSDIIEKTKSPISDELAESSDEDIINTSKFSKTTDSQKIRKKDNYSHTETFIQTLDQSKNISKSSRKSKSAIDIDNNDEHINNENRNTITPEITNKSRSRLLRSRTRVSDGQNVFENILDTEDSATLKESKLINSQRSLRSSQSKKSIQTLNDTRISSRYSKDSDLNQSKNASQTNKIVSNENTQNSNQEEESENETSTIPNNIRRTRSRLFQRSEVVDDNAFDNALDTENSGSKQVSQGMKNRSQNSLKLKLSVSQDLNRTSNRSTSQLREVRRPNSRSFKKPQVLQNVQSPRTSEDSSNESFKENQNSGKSENSRSKKSSTALKKNREIINGSKQPNFEQSNQQSQQKSKVSNIEVEENVATEDAQNQHRSVETSSDGTPKPMLTKNKKIVHISEKSVHEDYLSDDLLHTPNPAQSTLKISGKPVTRITEFSFRNSIINETESPRSLISSNRGSSPPPADSEVSDRTGKRTREEEKDNNEDIDVNVTNDSDMSECAMITRDPNDIPDEAENSTIEEETPLFLSAEPLVSRATTTQVDKNVSTIDKSIWAQVKKKTDALKVMMEAQKKQHDAIQREREREKAKTEMKLKRAIAQREAELKKQRKKPIDKAYYVNGKLYKQPKLPIPKSWVTDRLYKYLWKYMEPKFGLSTRIQAEKFVMKLSNIFTIVTRRKKYENYKDEVDDLMTTMAKLGIIKDRYDFYRFCREFMPYSFRIKVVPMQLPGNLRNIPYDPELVYKPILPDKSGSYESRSNNDSNSESSSKSNNEADSESGSENE